ncbi:MAG: CRISPR-associated endonuclease Cas2 [Patescibacteria group bacterium]|nr:CRISPR-associated endonuclease Cas2 [Patescibacteria group bacterium]
MPKKTDTLVFKILDAIRDLGEMVPMPFETPYSYLRRYSGIPRKKYLDTIRLLEKRGAVKISQKAAIKFVRLTRNGELELLLAKTIKFRRPNKWDGKWRMIMFDIPEQAHKLRDRLRWLLKKHHFMKIQQSAYISPWELNRAAVEYLIATGLKKFTRILRIDALDDDKELQVHFKLTRI